MPISRKDFDHGLDEITSKFFRTFAEFADNPNKALTLEDLRGLRSFLFTSIVFIVMLFRNKGLIKGMQHAVYYVRLLLYFCLETI